MTTSEYHDHTDTSPHPLITHHTIPTPSPTTQRTQPAPQTLGTPSSWTQLARPRRPEIHEPISITELRAHNRQYIHEKVIQNHAGPHWELMANEIAIEVQQGRIEQTGSDGKSKIRRGEDWRRSGHNKACHMTDQPFHLTPDHYTWLAQHSKTPHDHWCGDTTTTVPIASYHSMTLLSPTYSYSHHRFPYEIIQTTTTRTSAPDSGCHYPVRLHTRDNRALPRTHPQSYPTDPNSQANALLLPQTFSDESAVQPYVPYTTKHSPTTTNFQHTHTHTLSSLLALQNILHFCSPRQIPLRPTPEQHTIIYTDAFYKEGDRLLRLYQLLEEPDLLTPSPDTTNGWAAVIFHPQSITRLVFNGTVPPKLLKHFASNKAFIYFLEAWATIITPVLIQPLLTPTYIQLGDKDAATHAIIKGSGKHRPLNNLIGSHWTWHNRRNLTQILHRVPTHANIADPFSREDFPIARQLGWHILGPPAKRLLQTTQKIIGDGQFAHDTGFSKDTFIQQFQHLALQKMFPGRTNSP